MYENLCGYCHDQHDLSTVVRDHSSEYGLSQWEVTLQSKISSQWLNPDLLWSLALTGNILLLLENSVLPFITTYFQVYSWKFQQTQLQIRRLLMHWGWDKMAAILEMTFFIWIFFNENFYNLIKISLNFIHEGPVVNMPLLVEIMAWCQTGAKPLSEPMLAYVADEYRHHSASMSYSKERSNTFHKRSNWGYLLMLKKMAIVFEIFSNAFYWMKLYEFWLTFHWSLFIRVQLTILHHCFR